MLTPRDNDLRGNSPPLQGRGRGWGLSAGDLAELHARAGQMRANPTEPEKRLWRHLSNSQLGVKFRRQAVIGHFIADFLCPRASLIVEVDGDTHDAAKDRMRDDLLATRGYHVVRVGNGEVTKNIEGVVWLIRQALTAAPAESPHPNPSPVGEGFEVVRP